MISKSETKTLALKLIDQLENKKGLRPVLLDVEKLVSYTDYMLICSGQSFPHLRTMSETVDEEMAKTQYNPRRKLDTNTENPWLLIDYGDIIVHLFLEETREFYNLEKLWNEAKVVYPVQ